MAALGSSPPIHAVRGRTASLLVSTSLCDLPMQLIDFLYTLYRSVVDLAAKGDQEEASSTRSRRRRQKKKKNGEEYEVDELFRVKLLQLLW